MKSISLKALSILLITLIFGCSSEKEPAKTLPQLTTTTATSVTLNAASTGGNVSADGGAPVTSRGMVWSTSTAPTISLATKTTDGSGTGSFSSSIANLNPSTTYYARAYATNSIGTAYGNEITFTTGSIVLPTLTTTAITSITTNSAVSGGTISADGGGSITARGVVWSTSTSPTINLSTKTIDGSGTGSFTSSITNLNPSTNYYVRAYATNSAGTAYGNEIMMTTINIPIVTTKAISAITITTASSGGTISSDGGSSVTSRGVVWSTSQNPTITLNTKTTDGTGIGAYNSAISGLSASITYYIRAYATNSAGTAYGNQISFTSVTPTEWSTLNLNVSTYSDGTTIPQVTDPTAWANLRTGAWCYYNNNSGNGPTYGKLYNWYAVVGIWNTASISDVSQRKKLAPNGYHIPTIGEWVGFLNSIGGTVVAGGKMKETGTTHWNSPNSFATNSSGFTGLPGGVRTENGEFTYLGTRGLFWSSTEAPPALNTFGNQSLTIDYLIYLNYNNGFVDIVTDYSKKGLSVRCIKD